MLLPTHHSFSLTLSSQLASSNITRLLGPPLLLLFLTINLQAQAKNIDNCYASEPLGDALRLLENKGLKLAYSDAFIKDWMRIPKVSNSKDPITKLKTALRPLGLTAQSAPGDHWLIVQDEKSEFHPSNQLVGRISDMATQRAITDAQIYLASASQEANTLEDGCFILTGGLIQSALLTVNSEGFISKNIKLSGLNKSGASWIEIQLTRKKLSIDEVTIHASSHQLLTNKINGSHYLDQQQIENYPRIADDINRVFRHIPGMASGDFSPRTHTRGGLINETGITLDGVELFTPFYFNTLNGLTGIIDSNLLSEASVITGGYTADQGGNMSGKINLTSETDFGEHKSSIGFGSSPRRAFARTSGSFKSDQTRWVLSVRNADWRPFINHVEENSPTQDAQFNDVFMKAEWLKSDQTTITAGGLVGRDVYNFKATNQLFLTLENKIIDDIETHNDVSSHRYLWLIANTQWSHQLSSTNIISRGTIGRDVLFNSTFNPIAEANNSNRFSANSFKSEWHLELSDQHLVNWGLHLRYMETKYDSQRRSLVLAINSSLANLIEFDQHLIEYNNGWSNSAYISSRLRLFDHFISELGIRWDQQTYTNLGNDKQVSPRLNLVYEADEHLSFRLAWGQYYQPQAINELQIESGINQYYEAQRSEHWVLGATLNLGSNMLLNAETYRKDYSNLSPRFENFLDPVSSIYRDDLVLIQPSAAKAKGSELALYYDAGGIFTTALSYVYAQASDRIDERDIPRSWDQRNAITFDLNWSWNNTHLSIAGLYRSGWPNSEIFLSEFVFDDQERTFIKTTTGARNSVRSESYQRLDLRITQRFESANTESSLYLEVINILHAKNPCCNHNLNVLSNQKLEQVGFTFWLPRTLTMGITLDF